MAILLRPEGSGTRFAKSPAAHCLRDARFHRRQTCRRPELRTPVRMTAKSCATDIDVAVIGGGPGGLATAAALTSAFGNRLKIKVTD